MPHLLERSLAVRSRSRRRFDQQPKLFINLNLVTPAIDAADGAIDLHTGSQAVGDKLSPAGLSRFSGAES